MKRSATNKKAGNTCRKDAKKVGSVVYFKIYRNSRKDTVDTEVRKKYSSWIWIDFIKKKGSFRCSSESRDGAILGFSENQSSLFRSCFFLGDLYYIL